jgi:hypothetical protein
MACGLPVAAYPVQGPVDVIAHGRSGVLDEDLGRAVAAARELRREDCIEHARGFAWDSCSGVFESNLAFMHAARDAA